MAEQIAVKPHLKRPDKDYYAEYLQQAEESDSQAPLLVVVQGPSKCGKTTLIRSLVKHFTNHKIAEPQGPITVRSGKNARVTFLECPNSIHAMMDLSKVADLALIMIDASIGLEMETFEFISLLNNHGFPNVMGVLTHIDYFKDNKQLRKTRKKYKKRFEYEVGSGYKLFYLSGLKNSLYLKHDIINLARFISFIKYTPVRWKSEHPFILSDRFEKIDEERTAFYGYIRGCTYRLNDRVHFVGLGDFTLESMDVQSDPCEIILKSTTMRTLKQQDKVIYAPMTNLGFLNFDSAYINIPDQNVVFTDVKKLEKEGLVQRDIGDDEEEQDIVSNQEDEELQEGVKLMRDLQNTQQLQDKFEDDVELLDGIVLQEEEQITNINKEDRPRELIRLKDRVNQALKSLKINSSVVPINDQVIATDLHELIYSTKTSVNDFDGCRYFPSKLLNREEYVIRVKPFFVTGQTLEDVDEEEIISENKQIENEEEIQEEVKEDEKDKEYELEQQKQQKNKQKLEEMMTTNLGLYKRGYYVKVVLKGVGEKQRNLFKPSYPMILARTEIGEDNLGFVKIKIKKHRWYPNILKSNDPLIFSVGWRRFQSLPIYFMQDQNDRLRFIKYTPQYDYCFAVFYGNFAPQNTGVVCTQTLEEKIAKFRLAATGVVQELNHNYDIMKKLKLVGEPFKIYKNTAFIKGMFNSSLEASKFIGGVVKTVSGLRGQIKKISKVGPEGSFRAAFEDKILMSDIVFCRTWVKVSLSRYYRLVGHYNKSQRLMKTQWQLRKEKKLSVTQNPDSIYRDVERVERKFQPFKVPTRLQESLPFESKEKVKSLSVKEKIRRMESNLPIKNMLNDKEKQVYSLIQRLNTIKRQKDQKREVRDQEKKKIKEAREQGQKRNLELSKKKYKQEKMKEKFRKKSKQLNNQMEN